MKPLSTLHSHVCVVLLTCAGVLGLATTSQAIPIDQTITKNDAQLPAGSSLTDQTISFSGLNPNPTSAATITFSVRGDFNIPEENVLLSVDGFSFGTWLNTNLGDDTITGPANDIGNQYASILTGTAVIPLGNFSGLVADGSLDFLFNYSNIVGNANPSSGLLDLAQVRVQYEAAGPAVPEPGTIFLFGSGLVGLAAWRYRKNSVKV